MVSHNPFLLFTVAESATVNRRPINGARGSERYLQNQRIINAFGVISTNSKYYI